jgi:hypothetical protein
MSGYREQIRAACMQLGHHGDVFDYKDVMKLIPDGQYRPTPWEVIRYLQYSRELEVAEEGKWRKLTKYKLKKRGRKELGS